MAETPYTDDELRALLALAEGATEGPWHTSPSDSLCAAGVHDPTNDLIVAVSHYSSQGQADGPQEDRDAALIAAARTALPRLARELLAAREALARIAHDSGFRPARELGQVLPPEGGSL